MKRGIWKGSISFGLLNIPVHLHTATQDRGLHFTMLDSKTRSKIHYRRVNDEGKEVPFDEIVKGYEYEKGRYVIVTDQDFQAANPKATQAVEIEDFVSIDDIDLLLFETPYYITPQKSGEKGYFLLRDALKKQRRAAVGKVVIRTKQHLCSILPRGDYLVLEILRFAHEVKEAHEAEYLRELEAKPKYNERELRMAEQLIGGMSAKWKPEKYKDTFYDDMMKRIERKIKAGEGAEFEEPEVEKIRPAKEEDIEALLAASLKSSRKRRAGFSPAKRGGRLTSRRSKSK